MGVVYRVQQMVGGCTTKGSLPITTIGAIFLKDHFAY